MYNSLYLYKFIRFTVKQKMGKTTHETIEYY